MSSPVDVTSTSGSSSAGNGARILVVDDEPGNREMLSDVFEESGYQVERAATGQEALEKARGSFFHAAVLDVRLPDMNGTDLLVRLKEMHPDTAAIMITGYASLQTAIKALNSGAFAYILKPLDLDYLFQVTKQALEQQRALLENRSLLHQYQERIRELEQQLAALQAAKA